jgi:histidine decarboxylase
VDYIGTHDTTIGGSRSGHTPLMIWYALNYHGIDGLRERFHSCRQVAEHAVTQLNAAGWPAWRHPHAFTVVFDTPPDVVRVKWRLASSNGQSHLIAVPGISVAQIDALVGDLIKHVGCSMPVAERPVVPVPRHPFPLDGADGRPTPHPSDRQPR